jgi:hypothetical protein
MIFVERPFSAFFVACAVCLFALPVFIARRRRKRNEPEPSG